LHQLHNSEFQPQALDSLRQPIELGEVVIARAGRRGCASPRGGDG
jgi:predicted ATPase with chaperone activity